MKLSGTHFEKEQIKFKKLRILIILILGVLAGFYYNYHATKVEQYKKQITTSIVELNKLNNSTKEIIKQIKAISSNTMFEHYSANKGYKEFLGLVKSIEKNKNFDIKKINQKDSGLVLFVKSDIVSQFFLINAIKNAKHKIYVRDMGFTSEQMGLTIKIYGEYL